MKKNTRAILSMLLACLLLLGLTACNRGAPENGGDFTMDYLDTGKSDCVLVRMDGLVLLSDTADWDDFAQIDALLQEYGIEAIDYIVLSHYDKDHIGSAARLVEEYTVGLVIGPDYVEESQPYAALEAACGAQGVEWRRLTEDMTLETENGEILLDPPDRDYGDDNNNSILLTVQYRGENFLFMGDAKKKRIGEFLPVARDSYAIIKLPHHGDSNRNLETLVQDTRPEYAVEMVSPAEIVEADLLDALEETKTQLFLSRDGGVHVVWGRGGLEVQQREKIAG